MTYQTKNISVEEIDRKAFSYHVYISQNHKLVFFTIPKVACTLWMRLIYRIDGDLNWFQLPHYRKDKPLLKNLDLSAIERILNDPLWTKAVFYREPAERLLSAYLDKFCREGRLPRELFDAKKGEIDFRDLVDFAIGIDPVDSPKKGLHSNTDPHWKPQHLISNLKKFQECINFTGNFSHIAGDGQRLLEQLGLWEKYGQDGWGPQRNQGMFENRHTWNKQNTQKKLLHYYTEELLRQVRNAYKEDYQFLRECGLPF